MVHDAFCALPPERGFARGLTTSGQEEKGWKRQQGIGKPNGKRCRCGEPLLCRWEYGRSPGLRFSPVLCSASPLPPPTNAPLPCRHPVPLVDIIYHAVYPNFFCIKEESIDCPHQLLFVLTASCSEVGLPCAGLSHERTSAIDELYGQTGLYCHRHTTASVRAFCSPCSPPKQRPPCFVRHTLGLVFLISVFQQLCSALPLEMCFLDQILVYANCNLMGYGIIQLRLCFSND